VGSGVKFLEVLAIVSVKSVEEIALQMVRNRGTISEELTGPRRDPRWRPVAADEGV